MRSWHAFGTFSLGHVDHTGIHGTHGTQFSKLQSSHPIHTKRSAAYSQTPRVSRTCSQEEDYRNYCNQMK